MPVVMVNPFQHPSAVQGYEAWYEGPGRRADQLEKNMILRLLDWIDGGRSLLDVGSGTGHFMRFFNSMGLQVVGLDLSSPMLREAAFLNSPTAVLGDGHQLPFRDLSFDVITIITTLEFVTSPSRVLEEAVRVARRGVLIGALNRTSRLGRKLRSATDEPWVNANLLTVSQLRRCIADACEGLHYSLTWMTTLWPGLSNALRLPWGDFIGMAARWEGRAGRNNGDG